MPWLSSFLASGLFIWTAVTLVWILSLIIHDSSIVDIFWGLGYIAVYWFVALVWLGALRTPQALAPRQLLLGVLVTIWGLRLSIHIAQRNWGKGEDFRYARWRAEAGASWWWRSYFKVFLLQGAIMWLVAMPLLATLAGPAPQTLTWVDSLAVLVWLAGFIFEAGGDWQLARFKADPANKGKLLTDGLWRYTRHPNYFGDAVQWWGFYLFAFASGSWWTFISPLLMTFLLLRVSGVAMLERTLKESKPGYETYSSQTNAFFPGLPRGLKR
jgi:steroid 5-alpha reductase family enzyme